MDQIWKKKTYRFAACLLLAAVALLIGGVKLYRIQERDQSGILLAFDDYSGDNWAAHFDFFDEYDVKATFFINAAAPTDFCFEAVKRGHEIGYHTQNHVNLCEISEEEAYRQAVEPISLFREAGIPMTTFAYPYGAYSERLNEILLGHYKVVRGAYFADVKIKHNWRRGFVESASLDNANYQSQAQYEEKISGILESVAASKGAVVSFYSHAIDDGGAWCVSEEKLRFLFEKAKKLRLKFYTFQDLQTD